MRFISLGSEMISVLRDVMITLHYITLHYITLHYITLHYITLHYITLHYIKHDSYNFSFCSPESVVVSLLSNISACQNVTKWRPKSVSAGIFRVIDSSYNKTTLYQRYRNCLLRDWFLRCHYLASYSVNRADCFFKTSSFPIPFYGNRRFTTASHWKASSQLDPVRIMV